jgi:hypothetical protein
MSRHPNGVSHRRMMGFSNIIYAVYIGISVMDDIMLFPKYALAPRALAERPKSR